METILTRCNEEPAAMTYFAIGSAPHSVEGVLSPKEDQIIPLCFHELITKEKISMRIVHLDPWFEKSQEFLTTYFAQWNLVQLDVSSWVGDNLEVLVIPAMIRHEEDFSFFEALCQTILQKKGKLVMQEFTGHSLKHLQERLLKSSQNKMLFKRRVLMDMTFGTDEACSTDMTKAQPFYDYDGNFINLTYASNDEVKRWIGISVKLDALIKQKYKAEFFLQLNNIHVDYRRKLKEERLLFGSSDYTETSSPDEIMKVLQKNLSQSFEILLQLKFLREGAQEKLNHLFLNYKTGDPYKWYDSVRNLLM